MYHRKHRLVAQLLTARNGAQAAGIGEGTKEEKREVRCPHPPAMKFAYSINDTASRSYRRVSVTFWNSVYILRELEEIRYIFMHDFYHSLQNFKLSSFFYSIYYAYKYIKFVQITQSQKYFCKSRELYECSSVFKNRREDERAILGIR